MLACTIFSVFKKCLTIPCTNFSDYAVIANSLKLVCAINSDTKVLPSFNHSTTQLHYAPIAANFADCLK